MNEIVNVVEGLSSEMQAGFAKIDARFDSLEARFDRQEARQRLSNVRDRRNLRVPKRGFKLIFRLENDCAAASTP